MVITIKKIKVLFVLFPRWSVLFAAFLILHVNQADDEIWHAGFGEGLAKGAQGFELAAGPGFGVGSLEGKAEHDLAFFSASHTFTFSRLLGDPHWYRGNFALVSELFTGWQYNSRNAYFIGATPLLRYSIATGTGWVPFAEGGFGPTLTDIGEPDLSSRLQFNLQGGFGTHYFWNEHRALTLHTRWLHFSNAGFERPNIGVNTVVILLGTTWLF